MQVDKNQPAKLTTVRFNLPSVIRRGGIVSGSTLYLWHPEGIIEIALTDGIRGTIEVEVASDGDVVTGITETQPAAWPFDPSTTLYGELDRLTVRSAV